jgi:hypothetical protein
MAASKQKDGSKTTVVTINPMIKSVAGAAPNC